MLSVLLLVLLSSLLGQLGVCLSLVKVFSGNSTTTQLLLQALNDSSEEKAGASETAKTLVSRSTSQTGGAHHHLRHFNLPPAQSVTGVTGEWSLLVAESSSPSAVHDFSPLLLILSPFTVVAALAYYY